MNFTGDTPVEERIFTEARKARAVELARELKQKTEEILRDRTNKALGERIVEIREELRGMRLEAWCSRVSDPENPKDVKIEVVLFAQPSVN